MEASEQGLVTEPIRVDLFQNHKQCILGLYLDPEADTFMTIYFIIDLINSKEADIVALDASHCSHLPSLVIRSKCYPTIYKNLCLFIVVSTLI